MPTLFDNAVTQFSRLPGIGPKTALRLVLYMLRSDQEDVNALAEALIILRRDVKYCSVCYNISDTDICPICADNHRDATTICVVENIQDVLAIEQTQQYNGLYHVLGARISGGLSDESAEALSRHTRQLKPDEVIIATSPRIESDISYYEITDILRAAGVDNVTRIAYGLPLGGSIEFADRMTLHTALEGRRKVS